MSVLNDDVNQLERFLYTGANIMLQTVVTVPGIAAVAFLPMPVILYGSVRFQRLLEPRYAAVRSQVGRLNFRFSLGFRG